MRRIHAIRLTNARALAEEAGNALRFGERIGIGKSQASQIIGRRPIRLIGDEIAERIETAFKRPADWLDEDHSEPLLDMVAKLTPANRSALAEVARALLAAQRKR
jgi:hypothetical protein